MDWRYWVWMGASMIYDVNISGLTIFENRTYYTTSRMECGTFDIIELELYEYWSFGQTCP